MQLLWLTRTSSDASDVETIELLLIRVREGAGWDHELVLCVFELELVVEIAQEWQRQRKRRQKLLSPKQPGELLSEWSWEALDSCYQ